MKIKLCAFVAFFLLILISINTVQASPLKQVAFFDEVSREDNDIDFSLLEQALFGSITSETSTNNNSNSNGIDTSLVEQALFNRINEDRLAAGLAKIAWDEAAAKAAHQHAVGMAQNNFISHWNFSGKKPQQRYNEAGGIYATTENICLSQLKGYTLSQSLVIENAIKAHEEMMAEVPPYDGHRVNILDPKHTHAGVGVAYARQEDGSITIALAQEFTNHYAELNGIPKVLKPGESFAVSGSLYQPGLKLYAVILLWEKAPCPMSIEELQATHSYSSPEQDAMVSYALTDWPLAYFPNYNASGNKLDTDEAGNFSTTLQAGEKEGLNYLQVWLEDTAGNKFIGNEFVLDVHSYGY